MTETDTLTRYEAGDFDGVLEIGDRTGDTKLIWSRRNVEEVDVARKAFADLKKKGFLIYAVRDKDGSKGEQMHTFDPDEERLIAMPAAVGG